MVKVVGGIRVYRAGRGFNSWWRRYYVYIAEKFNFGLNFSALWQISKRVEIQIWSALWIPSAHRQWPHRPSAIGHRQCRNGTSAPERFGGSPLQRFGAERWGTVTRNGNGNGNLERAQNTTPGAGSGNRKRNKFQSAE